MIACRIALCAKSEAPTLLNAKATKIQIKPAANKTGLLLSK